MLKKISALLLIFFIASCTKPAVKFCPFITIPRDTAYATQKVNYADEFQIELIGFEGFCEDQTSYRRTVAIVTPIFEIRRLRDSDETVVDVSYFSQAVAGPPKFLGKKNYWLSVNIGRDERKKILRGKPITIRIPSENAENFEILMGMDVSAEEYKYNQRTFDIKYKYDDEVYAITPQAQREEIRAVEKVIQPETPVAPRRGKKSEEKGCNTCKAWNPTW